MADPPKRHKTEIKLLEPKIIPLDDEGYERVLGALTILYRDWMKENLGKGPPTNPDQLQMELLDDEGPEQPQQDDGGSTLGSTPQ